MRALFSSIVGFFLTPGGLLVMGALDLSLLFFLPLGIDFAVIVVTARRPELFWLYALLATLGSVIGAMGTFWVGSKVGEHGLTRIIPESRLEQVTERITGRATIGIAALGIIPPPFPFKLFVLASGALGIRFVPFIAAVAGVRFGRFMAEAGLAAVYGQRILDWMHSTVVDRGRRGGTDHPCNRRDGDIGRRPLSSRAEERLTR